MRAAAKIPMKFFVNARFLTQPITGVQRYGIEISRQIKRLNPDVVFLAPRNIIHEDLAHELDVVIIGNWSGHFWEQIELPIFLRKKKLPLLNLGNTAPLLYSLNWTTIHDLAFHHHPEWNSKSFALFYSYLIPRIAHKSKQIFTVSNTIKQELQSCYGLKNTIITYNGIANQFEENKQLAKEKIILSVGSFNKRKNHQRLIDAFLQSNLKDSYQLIFVGKVSKIFNTTLTAVHSSIIIYDCLNDEQLSDLYSRASIVVSVSLYEGFGIPILEGLMRGCKVLCSNIPAYKELFAKDAYFCDPLNVLDIQQQLEHLAYCQQNHLTYQIPFMFHYEFSATTILKIIAAYFDNKKTD